MFLVQLPKRKGNQKLQETKLCKKDTVQILSNLKKG